MVQRSARLAADDSFERAAAPSAVAAARYAAASEDRSRCPRGREVASAARSERAGQRVRHRTRGRWRHRRRHRRRLRHAGRGPSGRRTLVGHASAGARGSERHRIARNRRRTARRSPARCHRSRTGRRRRHRAPCGVDRSARDLPSSSCWSVLEGLSLEGEPASDRSARSGDARARSAGAGRGIAEAGRRARPVPPSRNRVTDVVGLLGLADTNVPAFHSPISRAIPLRSSAGSRRCSTAPCRRCTHGCSTSPGCSAICSPHRQWWNRSPDRASASRWCRSMRIRRCGWPARADDQLRLGLAARLPGGRRRAHRVSGGRVARRHPALRHGRARGSAARPSRICRSGDARGSAAAISFRSPRTFVSPPSSPASHRTAAAHTRLELLDVHFANVDYPKLDLTQHRQRRSRRMRCGDGRDPAALGNSATALHIAALAGLAPPRDPAEPVAALPGWTAPSTPVVWSPIRPARSRRFIAPRSSTRR